MERDYVYNKYLVLLDKHPCVLIRNPGKENEKERERKSIALMEVMSSVTEGMVAHAEEGEEEEERRSISIHSSVHLILSLSLSLTLSLHTCVYIYIYIHT